MRIAGLFSSKSFPAYSGLFIAVLAAISSQLALSGALRYLAPFFLTLAFSFSLVSIILGTFAAKTTGLAVIGALTWAIFNTQAIGNAGLFLIASGAWFWLGVPLTLLLGIACIYLNNREKS